MINYVPKYVEADIIPPISLAPHTVLQVNTGGSLPGSQ